MRRLALVALIALGLAPALQAGTVAYRMDPAASTVAFETDFGPDLITGSIPLERADLRLDFANVRNCTVDVALDVTGAQASFPFAAQALKGSKVLDARAHPRMTFTSTSVKGAGDAAEVTGDLTIRGVTKRVTLQARLSRPKGSAPDALDHLTVRLSGKVNRSDFGATGWSDMVGDEVRILITARIDAQG
ncbi:YceI family protein [Tabrizicola flagellatus]|uniref:YceI family protein n=1 Tax=Tabrizicola flagellatus TaxID=2593021 RepID=UPI0011F38D46|nr:YceI family protein [Tabrizicola flagellatus]